MLWLGDLTVATRYAQSNLKKARIGISETVKRAMKWIRQTALVRPQRRYDTQGSLGCFHLSQTSQTSATSES